MSEFEICQICMFFLNDNYFFSFFSNFKVATPVMTGIYHYQVLSLYKQILRLAKSWTAASGRLHDTEEERTYIQHEAQILFRKNMHVCIVHTYGWIR